MAVLKESRQYLSTSVYPEKSEILNESQYIIKRNRIKGPCNSASQYLNRHFHLLREDFVSSLRTGLQEYLSNNKSTKIDVYQNVKIQNVYYRSGHKGIKMQHNSFQQIPNIEDKKFMRGSLLVITQTNFKTIWSLAKVERRKGCEVFIKLVDEILISDDFFTVAECRTFFEPYFQVLKQLKTVSYLPMEKYLIQVDSTITIPKYLRTMGADYRTYEDFDKVKSQLNSAQQQAYEAALSQEFVVIQGPPGTGKTHLGLKIAETLLRNSSVWYRNSPMLVISHKNHALDQFLEGLIPITPKLLRLGGQSKSEKLKTLMKEKDLKDLFSRLSIKNSFGDALVVGMTTTTAARINRTSGLECPIVIVEEAAEVLESHVVAALSKNCQHLILLGDHKQLKPNTSDYTIGTNYRLGVSLFERMVLNGIRCYQLETQHRMQPEISRLLRKQIYPFLKDHQSVKERDSINGVTSNVFFFDHNFPEEVANITSKKNVEEAKFVVALARYLVLNGYGGDDIVILTSYLGQVSEIESLLSKQAFDVKVSTLDAFQGQEANIVLLSLVRSKEIGFMSAENRICVALSRARNGLYVTGNMELLSKQSKIWESINLQLTESIQIGPFITLRCQNHPNTITNVKTCEDFKNVPFGGCYRKCEILLKCGHRCRFGFCHPVDKKHVVYKCLEVCEKLVTCDRKHEFVCKLKCYEECRCFREVIKRFDCGHLVLTKCSTRICPRKHSLSDLSSIDSI